MAGGQAQAPEEGDAEAWGEVVGGAGDDPGAEAAIAEYEARVEEARAELERTAEKAGLRRDPMWLVWGSVSGFFGLLPGFLRLINRQPAALMPHQEERLREDARRVLSSEGRRMVMAATKLRWALYVAVPTAALALGWSVRGAMPVDTAFGPLPRDVVELLRANDLARAARLCRDEQPQNGFAWCSMPLWRPGQGAPRG